MNELLCTGLDGSNPLHFLAALGVLRLLAREHADTRLAWRWETGGWRPILRTPQFSSVETVSERLAAWFNALAKTGNADPSLSRKVNTVKTSVKNAALQVKEATKKAKADAKVRGLRGADAKTFIAAQTAELTQRHTQLDQDLRLAQDALGDALGCGIAHLGDIIGVKSDLFRRKAQAAVDRLYEPLRMPVQPCQDDAPLVAGQMAALACDQVLNDGKVCPTPFSFGNGASHQCLLKDFRHCAVACTPQATAASLTGQPARFVTAEGLTSLNWDPEDQQSYALSWADPAGQKHGVDVAANALAFVGLGMLSAVPTANGRLAAVAFCADGAFRWPLWEPFIDSDTLMSLLASPLTMDDNSGIQPLRQVGVVEVRESRRINPNGKRFYFSPSRPL